jgi:hypothetical protein
VLIDDVIRRDEKDVERPEDQVRKHAGDERQDHAAQQVAIEDWKAPRRDIDCGMQPALGKRRHMVVDARS